MVLLFKTIAFLLLALASPSYSAPPLATCCQCVYAKKAGCCRQPEKCPNGNGEPCTKDMTPAQKDSACYDYCKSQEHASGRFGSCRWNLEDGKNDPARRECEHACPKPVVTGGDATAAAEGEPGTERISTERPRKSVTH